MGLSQITDRGGSALQIIPCTIVDGALDDTLGTAISLSVIGDVELGFNLTGSETSDEYNEIQLVNGITVKTPKVTKAVDKSGNEVVTTSGGGGGTGNSIVANVYESDYQFLMEMQGLIGDTFIAWVPLGDRNHDGFAWILGRFDGELKLKRSGNAYNSVPLTIVGKSLSLDAGATAAALITALGTAVTSISQPGITDTAPGTPLNPETNITSANAMLVAGDIANPGLLAGTLVFKKGS